jgi:hypothetical protein
LIDNGPRSAPPASISVDSADYRINALLSQEELRNAFRPYRSALLCAKFSAVSQDKPLVELSARFSDLLAVGAAPVRT